MRIIRCIDELGNVVTASLDSNDNATELDGSIENGFRSTGKAIVVKKLLAPLEPKQIFCIGLNYAFHAKETESPLPEFRIRANRLNCLVI
jgi:2-keto-4-pentenoate hydratase/2-oxohepta-3-ene-1,7-dioic acid hydratase in catechol pathway